MASIATAILEFASRLEQLQPGRTARIVGIELAPHTYERVRQMLQSELKPHMIDPRRLHRERGDFFEFEGIRFTPAAKNDMGVFWRAKPLEDLTRQELIDALIQLDQEQRHWRGLELRRLAEARR